MNKKITLVVPALPGDVYKITGNLEVYFNNLPISKICIIGNRDVEKKLPDTDKIVFMEEDKLIDIAHIRRIMIDRTGDEQTGKRAGWYVQQFIKMEYARICDDEYYLLWDSDTVPVKKIKFFDADGKPYLDCKSEFHKPYFDTMARLFPDMKKEVDESFISEHMLIRTHLMREMLEAMEKNYALPGKHFTEKVIYAITPQDIGKSGFSEFETFGTYVTKEHPTYYALRKWASMRYAGFFYDGSKMMTETKMIWLAKRYDAVTFEKTDGISLVSGLINSSAYMSIFPAKSLEFWAFVIRGFHKLTGRRR